MQSPLLFQGPGSAGTEEARRLALQVREFGCFRTVAAFEMEPSGPEEDQAAAGV